jgi:hypothetical protein
MRRVHESRAGPEMHTIQRRAVRCCNCGCGCGWRPLPRAQREESDAIEMNLSRSPQTLTRTRPMTAGQAWGEVVLQVGLLSLHRCPSLHDLEVGPPSAGKCCNGGVHFDTAWNRRATARNCKASNCRASHAALGTLQVVLP